MTQREKILAGGVAFVILLVIGQMGFNRYNSALKRRQNRIDQLSDQVSDNELREMEAALADIRASEYGLRSLPSKIETARAQYNEFLTDVISSVGLQRASAQPSTVIPKPGLYTTLAFRVTGDGSAEQLIEVMHRIHSMDYLHRIPSFSVQKLSEQQFKLDMTLQALALDRAPLDAEPPSGPSPLVAADINEYLLPIMNRNPLAPPNQIPRYAADRSVDATVGEQLEFTANFKDPDESQRLTYELVGDVPDGIRFDDRTGKLTFKPDTTGEIEVRVKATDNGWPRQTSEETLVIKVEEPAPEEPPPAAFDEATQTFLTGLTQSRGKWMAMIHIRTQGKTLKLFEDDTFSVGSMELRVAEIQERFVTLEYEGDPFVLRFDISLADAWRNAAP